MSNLTNFPNIRPSLLLDFAGSGRVDPRIQFTRATTATRMNSKGLIEVVPAGVPRIDYDPVTGECLGLLVEEARTNLCLQSSPPGGYVAPWTSAGAIGNWAPVSASVPTLKAPDGSISGIAIGATASAGFKKLEQRVSVSPGIQYTFSAWVLVVEGQWLLDIATANSNVFVAASVVTSAPISASSSWVLVSVTYVVPATGVNQLGVGLRTAASNAGGSAVVWGAQLESGAVPTSYIPTTTAAVTRAAELVQMTGNNFTDWYRPDRGTFVMEANVGSAAGTLFSLGSQSFSTRIGMYGYPISVQVVTDGATQVQGQTPGASSAYGDKVKIAMAMMRNDFAWAKNGGAVGIDVLGEIASPTAPFDKLFIGSGAWASGSVDVLNHRIRRIAFYPARLANAQVQALTAP